MFEALGFSSNPFVVHNAEREPLLSQYFVTPPYFEGVIGDVSAPTSVIVFAPRGGGKSAQRIMLHRHMDHNGFLVVDYVDFHAQEGEKQQTLNWHLGQLIALILQPLNPLLDLPAFESKLTEEESITVMKLDAKYQINNPSPVATTDFQSRVANSPHLVKYRGLFGEMSSPDKIVAAVLAHLNDLPESRLEHLKFLIGVAKKLGKKGICVNVDKVDETGYTGAPESAFRLIRPLLCDVSILELDGICFKMFLWNELKPSYVQHGRPDRVTQYDCTWDHAKLLRALSERLRIFSTYKISTLKQIVETVPEFDPDAIVASLANRSPRNMVRLCEKILASHAQNSHDKSRVSLFAFEEGVLAYCRDIVDETYSRHGQKFPIEVQKLGKEVFSQRDVEVALGLAPKDAGKKITDWLSADWIFFAGTWADPKLGVAGPKNPAMPIYGIPDPTLVRLACVSTSSDMLPGWWLPCQSCGHGIFVNPSNKHGTFNCRCTAPIRDVLSPKKVGPLIGKPPAE